MGLGPVARLRQRVYKRNLRYPPALFRIEDILDVTNPNGSLPCTDYIPLALKLFHRKASHSFREFMEIFRKANPEMHLIGLRTLGVIGESLDVDHVDPWGEHKGEPDLHPGEDGAIVQPLPSNFTRAF